MILMLLVSYQQSFSDAGLFKYKNCFWGNKKYTTWARVKTCPSSNQDQDRSCRACTYMCYTEAATIGWPSFGAHAVSWLGSGGPGFKLAEKKGNCFQAGSKNKYKIVKNNKLPRIPNPPPTYDEIYAKDTFSEISFNSEARTITIENYFAHLYLNHDDLTKLYVNLTIKGIYNKQEDTIVDNDSIFTTLNLYLQGANSPSLTGFGSNDFITQIGDYTVQCDFVGGNIVINVPLNVDFEKIGILLDLDIGDATDEEGEPFTTKIEKAQNISFEINNIFPSPTHDVMYININSNQNISNTVRIIDISGKEVYLEKNVKFAKGNNFKQIDTQDLKPGNYILILSNGRRNYRFKFIKS